jgi:hypothetical protein
MVGERNGAEERLNGLATSERQRARLPIGRQSLIAVRSPHVDRARPDLRNRGLLLADNDAGDAHRDLMLAQRPTVPLGEVAVRLLQRAQQATGNRECFAGEELSHGARDLVAELSRALVDRLSQHQ